jgi:hypothetical protein
MPVISQAVRECTRLEVVLLGKTRHFDSCETLLETVRVKNVKSFLDASAC